LILTSCRFAHPQSAALLLVSPKTSLSASTVSHLNQIHITSHTQHNWALQQPLCNLEGSLLTGHFRCKSPYCGPRTSDSLIPRNLYRECQPQKLFILTCRMHDGWFLPIPPFCTLTGHKPQDRSLSSRLLKQGSGTLPNHGLQ
jgi:hypothetical protein